MQCAKLHLWNDISVMCYNESKEREDILCRRQRIDTDQYELRVVRRKG